MKNISVSKLVDYRRIKKQGPKLTFIKNLNKPKPKKKKKGGGDYWIYCTSACAATFLSNDFSYIEDKILELTDKISLTKHRPTKGRFKLNIEILNSMLEFDFEKISPSSELKKRIFG